MVARVWPRIALKGRISRPGGELPIALPMAKAALTGAVVVRVSLRGNELVAVEQLLRWACEACAALVGPLVTILMVALTFGLICLAVVLTILVLWKFFSWGARFTMLKAWLRAKHYIVET